MLPRGKLAARIGCNSETIRYYEATGLLPAPARNASGYRIYSADHLRRLNFIQRAKALGFSSEQLRGLLNLHAPGENHTRAAVKSLTESHIDTIADKIRTCSASSVVSVRFPRFVMDRRKALIPARFWNPCSTTAN